MNGGSFGTTELTLEAILYVKSNPVSFGAVVWAEPFLPRVRWNLGFYFAPSGPFLFG
jgi:hypothetical protein